MKKFSILFVVTLLTFGLLSVKEGKKNGLGLAGINHVWAQTTLDPGDLDLSTAEGRVNMVRFLYYLVNGGTDDFTVSGPEDGYMGLVNTINTELGAVLTSAGYTSISSCADIPTSGTITGTDSSGTSVSITAAEGTKTVPAYFPTSAGETFDKRFTVEISSTQSVVIEINCETDANVRTLYAWMDDSDESRTVETYFQKNVSTNAVYVDFYTEEDESLIANRFITTDGDTFSLWLVRVALQSNGGSANIGIKGISSQNLAKLHMHADGGNTITPTNTTAIEDADIQACLSTVVGSEATSTECEANSLTVENASDTLEPAGSDGSAGAFTIGAVNNNLTLGGSPSSGGGDDDDDDDDDNDDDDSSPTLATIVALDVTCNHDATDCKSSLSGTNSATAFIYPGECDDFTPSGGPHFAASLTASCNSGVSCNATVAAGSWYQTGETAYNTSTDYAVFVRFHMGETVAVGESPTDSSNTNLACITLSGGSHSDETVSDGSFDAHASYWGTSFERICDTQWGSASWNGGSAPGGC